MLFKRFFLAGLLTFCLNAVQLNGQSFTVSGFVFNQETGEVMVGAYVFCPQTGVGSVTNNSGYYALSIPYGTKNLMYLLDGFAAKIDTTAINRNKHQNVQLRALDEYEAQTNPFKNATKAEPEIEVSDSDEDTAAEVKVKKVSIKNSKAIDEIIQLALSRNIKIIDRIENGIVEIPGLQISNMPSLVGEVDVIRGLKFLPGAMPGTELTNGLYVRGGGQDQNLVLIDGTPIYNMNHLFGFYSVFNSDGINSINLTKSGFSAKNGGRLSAITDITMKEGNANKASGVVSQSLLAFRLELNGPLSADGRTTFAFAGRRSYLDLFTRLGNNDSNKLIPTLYDFNLKVCHRINDRNKLIFSIFNCRDRFYTKRIDSRNGQGINNTRSRSTDLNWGNFIGSVRLNKVINQTLFATFSGSFSQYRNNYIIYESSVLDTSTGVAKSDYSINYYNFVRDFTTKADFDYNANKTNMIHFGASVSIKGFVPGTYHLKYTVNNVQQLDTNLGAKRVLVGNEYAAYVEDEIRLNNRMKLSVGARFVNYNYQKNNFIFIEPRVSFNAKIKNEYAVKASYTVMNQNIHSLENNFSSYITDRWVPATGAIQPQRSQQISLGISKPYKHNIELSIEAYYKALNRVLELKEGASFDGDPTARSWEDKVVMGKGWCYGVETFLHKKRGDFNGWISYTLSWAKRNAPNVNRGLDYYYQFDRRHYVNIVAQQKIDDRNSISVNMVFSTGNVQSLPIGKYRDINGNIVYDYTGKNNYRLNNTFRFDVGLKRVRNRTWGTESGYNISIYNVFARNNPAYVYVNNAPTPTNTNPNPPPTAYQVSFLGFIPGITYYTKF
ncbi:MAG: carboxypeptidase-like regulatory domain-containing protein [bacterium]|nr:carboxypeptidase-like regulatory domain-containing protein [bacterium]